MPVSMNYLSSEEIDNEDFKKFLSELGVEVDSNDNSKAVWSLDDGHIWISREDKLIGEYEQEDLDVIYKKLDAIPSSLFVVELSESVGSSRLATKFAYEFGLKWNILVDDLYENIYSFGDIKVMYKDGGSFE